MSARTDHKFEFSANAIAQAALDEATYHEQRIVHWQNRYEAAKAIVKETVTAEVVETEVTGGLKHLSIHVRYGDQSAWDEASLAYMKIQSHRTAAERLQTEARIYGTQKNAVYELDSADVYHFKLGGEPRED